MGAPALLIKRGHEGLSVNYRNRVHATRTIPIVIASSGDPVVSGLAASLAHPGGNVTGQTIMLEEMAIKRLELLKEAVPSLSRVAVLWSASNPIYEKIIKNIERAGRRVRVQVRVIAVRSPHELDGALVRVKASHCNGLYVLAARASARG